MLILCNNYSNSAKVAQRTEIIQQNRDHADWGYNYIDKNVHVRRLRLRPAPETSTCEVPSDGRFTKVAGFAADFAYDNGVVEVSLLHV